MKQIGFYNGKWDELQNLTVPALDRALYFGDGVYDAAYTVGKKIFALDEHLDRFRKGCLQVGIILPYGFDEMKEILQNGVNACEDEELFVYMQASSGIGIRNHANRNLFPTFLVMIYPKKIAEKGKTLNVVTTNDNRYGLCNIKTLNLMPNVLAAQKAENAGCDEAVFIRMGEVTECSHSNIQILQKGKLISPPPSFCTLGGIGRKHLLQICRRSGICVEERRPSKEELFSADEVIVTSAGYPCQRVKLIDRREVGQKSGALFEHLQQEVYREYER